MEVTMQTLTIEVKDDFMTEFMHVLNNFKDNIKIKKDGVLLEYKNLEQDPYFYERQKELQQIRDDIKSGKSKTTSFEDFELEMDKFEKKLEIKYAS